MACLPPSSTSFRRPSDGTAHTSRLRVGRLAVRAPSSLPTGGAFEPSRKCQMTSTVIERRRGHRRLAPLRPGRTAKLLCSSKHLDLRAFLQRGREEALMAGPPFSKNPKATARGVRGDRISALPHRPGTAAVPPNPNTAPWRRKRAKQSNQHTGSIRLRWSAFPLPLLTDSCGLPEQL